MHVETAMTHARDDLAGGGGLARFHARAGEGNHGYAARVERCVVVEPLIANARGHADALAEIRELQDDADHACIERAALLRIDGIDDAEHAADVEHLDDVARLDRLGQMTRIAEQRLTVSERAYDDVALRLLRHAAAR